MMEPKTFLNRELIETEDGSSSLYIPALDETYHNRKGAIIEAEFIFIEKGLNSFGDRSELTILEVGFGTGLNTLLTLLHKPVGQKLNYIALEPYPLNHAEWSSLNYPQLLGLEPRVFSHIHTAIWGDYVAIETGFVLKKIDERLENWEPGSAQVDLVYFDAFAPNKQADVWSLANLEKIYRILKSGGLLVTYSAQGAFKRSLRQCGFECSHPPGPMGKKEMSIARKA